MDTDPASMTVHNPPSPQDREALEAPGRTRGGRIRMLLILALCAAPVIASYFTFYVIQPRGRAYSDLIVPSVDMPLDLPLQALDGSVVKAATLKGQWLLVAVQGSACDALCDRLLFMQRQLHAMLGKERGRVTKVWLIPDAGAVSDAVLQAVNEGSATTVLRVPKPALDAWLAPAKGHASSEHLYMVDPMGNWMLRTPAQADPVKVKQDIDRLLRASASWDRPGR